MPTFKLTDPNTGRVVRVTGATPPNEQEIASIFSNLGVEKVKPITEAERSQELRERLDREQAEELNPFEAAAVAAGRGLTSVGRGLGLVDQEDPRVTEAFKALEKESPISTTVGEIAGEAAPFLLPGGAVAKFATIPGRVAAATALGATESAILSEGKGASGEDSLKSAGVGGVIAGTLEATLPIVGKIGGKLFRKITGKNPASPLINSNGQPTKEFTEALDKAGMSFDDVNLEASRLLETGNIDDAVQLARKQFLEEQGLTPTRAQVTGDKTQFQTQQELGKTSGKVSRALEGQEEVLANKFENALTSTGGSASASNSSTIDFIADRSIDLDKNISDAYKAAREFAPKAKIIKPTGFIEEVRSIAGSDRATGGLVSASRDILKSKGVIGKGFKKPGAINAEAAEEIRKDLNSLYDSLTPFGKKKLSDFKNAIDKDVSNAVGSDIFAEARKGKAKFEKDLNRAKVNKFDKRNKSLVRDILENKVNPDRFFNDAILSKSIRSDDVQQLKSFLHLDGSPDGAKAWNDVRAEAMSFIKDNAIKEVGGDPALSRAGLEKGLKSLGREKMMILFTKEERKFLSDMLKTSKLREPKRGTALGKGPSAQGMKNIAKAIDRIPLINLVFSGALEMVQTGVANRAALRQPVQSALKPSQFTRLNPAITTTTTEEKQTPNFTVTGG